MRRPLLLVNAVSLIIGVSYGMHNPIIPLFAGDAAGATYSEIGAIGVANFAPYIFVPLFVGMLLDRFNRGWILTVGVAINTASTYALSFAHTVPEIMACRIGTGVAHAFFWPACQTIISSVSTGADRVRNIARFVGFFVAGFTVGPLLGSLFLGEDGSGYRMLFQISAFVMAAALISSVPASRIRSRSPGLIPSLAGFRRVFSLPEIVTVLIYSTAAFGAILAVYPAFLAERGAGAVSVEVLYFVFGLSRIITLVCAKRFAGHTAAVLALAVLAIAAGMAVSYFGDGLLWYAFALLLMGFGFSATVPLMLEVVLSRAGNRMSGSVIGAYESIFGVGWVIGPVMAGLLSYEYGGAAPYIAFAAAGLGVFVMAAIRRSALRPAVVQD